MDYQIYLDQIMRSAPLVAKGLLTLVIGFWGANKVSDVLKASMTRRKVDENVRPFLLSGLNIGIKVLVLITVAGMFGIETTSFIAVFAAMAFAIGSALSGSLGHFASGVLILMFRPYKVGDLVQIGDCVGTVDEIQLFNTVLRTLDNKKVIIPNGNITQGSITNISGQGELRVDMNIYTDIDADVDIVKNTIQAVAERCPLIIKPKQIDILLHESKSGASQYIVRAWCVSEYYWDVYYFMQEQIKKDLAKAGVKMPKNAH
jgi:small conductance mechanosensitive channel